MNETKETRKLKDRKVSLRLSADPGDGRMKEFRK